MITQKTLILLINIVWASGQLCSTNFPPKAKFSTDCTGRLHCIDCQTSQSCLLNEDYIWAPFLKAECEGERPYCDPNKGSCVAYTPEECARPSTSFRCIEDGIFPDPEDLKKYHECENGTSKREFSCGPNYFDLVTKNCQPLHAGTLFPTKNDYDCTGMNGHQKPLMSSSYYVFCIEETPLFIGTSLAGNFNHVPCNYFDYYRKNIHFCKGFKRNLELPLFSQTCDRVSSCINCTTGRVCSGGNGHWKEEKVFNCEGVTPFCEPALGVCVDYSPETCATPDHSFVCTDDGIYPDPYSTSKYYVCHEKEAQGFTCGFESFDLRAKGCGGFRFKRDWCQNVTGSLVSMEGSEYFIYCHNRRAGYVDKCPEHYYLDAEIQRCVPGCSMITDGTLFPDTLDCTRYYRCSFDSTKNAIIRISMACNDGEVFNRTTLSCEKLNKTN